MTAPLLQNLDHLEEALSQSGLEPTDHREMILRVHRHLLRYTHLEAELLGGVSVTIPRHLLGSKPAGDSTVAVETLARRERERLALADHGAGSIMECLDRELLKTYRAAFPAESSLQGFFLFDQKVGPALIVDEGLESAEDNFVFARLYGHYLLDNDPYVIRVIRRAGPAADASSDPARAFAAAFVIDGVELKEYLRASGWESPSTWTEEMVSQMTAFFEVGRATLATRLRGLGYMATNAALPGENEAPDGARPSPSLSERFVRLALEAQARELLTYPELADYLETDVGSASELAHRFRLRPEREAEVDRSGEEESP